MLREIKQLVFDFAKGTKSGRPFRRIAQLATEPPVEAPSAKPHQGDATGRRDASLEAICHQMLGPLGMTAMKQKLHVVWNSRLRSSAGFASYPAWRIELNPKLRDFDGQVERTLKHELAHLIAFQRAGHTKIDAHGAEWRRACSDIGIPDERAHHHLPLPRNEVKRNFLYVCVSCGLVVRRVRKFRRYSACRTCCSKHGDGSYDERFRFEQVTERNVDRYRAILDAEQRR